MTNIYLEINLALVTSWLLYRFAPALQLSFRARKVNAQLLLVTAVVAPIIVGVLPVSFFPQSMKLAPIEVRDAENVGLPNGLSPSSDDSRVSIVVSTSTVPRRSMPTTPLLFAIGAVIFFLVRMRERSKVLVILKDAFLLHRIGRVIITVSDRIDVPFSTMSAGRSHVVLPSSMLLNRLDFRMALRHEIEHHRRRDTLWAIVMEWLLLAFYWNPSVYLWKKTLLNLQELACDEALIGRMGISEHSYGSCLIRVAETALNNRIMHVGTTCMIPSGIKNGHSFLRRRIEMFQQHKRPRTSVTRSIALGTGLAFCLSVTTFTVAAALQSGGANPGHARFDEEIQSIATESLQQGIKENDAGAGFAIVADVKSGKVLAAANINNGFDSSLKNDWSLSYPLAPASALKPLIIASALQKGATTLDTEYDCAHGEYRLGDVVIHDAEAFAKLSTADTIVHSSNVCAAKIGQTIGAEGILSALREFGIGGETVKDFPAAASGSLPIKGAISDDTFIAQLTVGESARTGFSVTPLEMVQAYAAIANGGHLMRAEPMDSNHAAVAIRDVLSPAVAAKMRTVLRRVVAEGTARGIEVSRVPLAGKTSSGILNGAQRVGGFIGYAPADQPKYVIYVVIIDPKKDKGHGHGFGFGSLTAGPVFRAIANRIL